MDAARHYWFALQLDALLEKLRINKNTILYHIHNKIKKIMGFKHWRTKVFNPGWGLDRSSSQSYMSDRGKTSRFLCL